MSELTKLVKMPAPSTVNSLCSPCPTSFLERKYGRPRKIITSFCTKPTESFWVSRMVTEDVGPFKVYGHRLAVRQLRLAMTELKQVNPKLYNALGHVGMCCVRWVRGSTKVLSNHSWGLAIDFTIEGILDVRGDDKVQKGLLDLYHVMKKYGFYWGVEFGTEDGMHFELGAELVMQAIRSGEF